MIKRISRRVSLLVVIAMLLALWPSFQSQAQQALSPLTSVAATGGGTAIVGLPTPIGTPGANFTPSPTPNEPTSPGPNKPLPTATPFVDPHLPGLVTHISFSTNQIQVGSSVVVSITVSNEASNAAQNLAVTMPLPNGATPTGPISWSMTQLAGQSSATFTTTLQLTNLQVGSALLVSAQANATGLSSADATSAGILVVDHSGGAASTQFTPGTAAILHSSDNQVTVNFPAGAYTSTLALTHSFQPPVGITAPLSTPNWKQGFGTFYLTATDGHGQAVHQFAQPLTITVGYTQAQLQALGIQERDLTIYWYDDSQQIWKMMPTTVNTATQSASIQVNHFSSYQLGDNSSASSVYLPNLQGGRTDLFTGAASYSIPIDVPAGAGGLRPNLSLSYNSAATDGEYGQRPNQQSSWVGKGWSLDTGSISMGLIQGSNSGVPYLYYTLAQNGQSYDLIGTCMTQNCSTNFPTQWNWHTTNENFSKILPVRVADSTTDFYGTTAYPRFKWDVWTKDGTMYEYAQDDWWGFDNNSCSGGDSFMQPYNWNLTMVQDLDGNVIKYTYGDVTAHGSACRAGANGNLDLDVYPMSVTWDGAPFSGNNPRYQITFNSSDRGSVDRQYDNASNAISNVGPHETRQLNNIQVQSNYTGSSWDLVREYNLAYNTQLLSDSWTCVLGTGPDKLTCVQPPRYISNPNAKLTLASVQAEGNKGGLLPAITFSYGTNPGDGTNQYSLGPWNRLVTINNGQNGATTFAYDNIGQIATDPIFINNRRVNQRTLDPAVNNPAGYKYVYRYSYQHPAYNWLSHGSELPNSAALYNADHSGQDFQLAHQPGTLFRGHSQVTETAPDGTQTIHTYYQGDAGCTDLSQSSCFNSVRDNEVFVGKESHSLTVGSDGQQVGNLKEETNSFTDQFNSPSYPFSGLWNSFSYINQNVEGNWGNNGSGTWISKPKTTSYYFDTSFGNMIQMNEYDANGTLVRYTSDHYGVISNTTTYMVNRKTSEDQYNGALQHVALTFYLYDGNNQALGTLGGTVNGHASYGHMTRQMEFYNVPLQGDLSNVQLYGKDTSYGFDAFGNQTSDTYYSGSGQNGGAAAAIYQWNGSQWYWNLGTPGSGGAAHTTTTTYETVFNAFVTQVRQPQVSDGGANITLITGYDYDYPHGTKKQVTDPNNNTTNMQYDEFNRITAVAKPGDSLNPYFPTEWWIYHDTEVPVRYEDNKREYAGIQGYWPVQTFYDGMGQKIQTKTEDKWSPTHENIIVDQSYNASPGQVTQQSQPLYWQGDDTTFWQYQVPTGVVWTTTSYDGLGRTHQVQQPDGTTTTNSYTIVATGRATTMTDPNGKKSRTEYDTLGRMTQVVELNSDNSTYASTSYSYSPLQDLLTGITNNNGVHNFTTSASYDSLGRKTQSVDPDRGTRNYTYDVNGNQIQESDAKSQNIYNTYDELNRLTQTSYSTNGTTAVYQYDQGAGNWGYRTTMMRQTSQVIETTWAYDARGRVSETQYTAGGHGPYIYVYSYNSGDQVNTLNLASGGEVITYGYDAAWRPYSLSSSLGDVSIIGTDYTALNQPKDMVSGNGAIETWNYAAPMQRLSQIEVGSGSNLGSIWNRSYTSYDNDGSIKTVVDNNASSTQTFSYDPQNRLQVWGKTGQATQNYGYDTMGNLTSYAGTTYSYGSGTYCSGPHQMCQAGSSAYSYDANGNQYGGGRTNNWNADDQLAGYTQGGYTESDVYDADGERAIHTASTLTTLYLGPLFEMDVQTSNFQNTISRRTFYKLGSQIVAQRNTSDNSLIYLHTDSLGSVVRATGPGAAVVYTYEYNPWGNVTNSGGINQTLISYTGLHKDNAYFYDHARYYDASIQHFNAADTVVPGVANPQNLNRYSYVNNNPMMFIDPTGHRGSPNYCGGASDPCVGYLPGNTSPINLTLCITGVTCQANGTNSLYPPLIPHPACGPMNNNPCISYPYPSGPPNCSDNSSGGPQGDSVKLDFNFTCNYNVNHAILSYSAWFYNTLLNPPAWSPEGGEFDHTFGPGWFDNHFNADWQTSYIYVAGYQHEVDYEGAIYLDGVVGYPDKWPVSGKLVGDF